jgi:ABC-type branched-subunit amino acid transport system permease subunit
VVERDERADRLQGIPTPVVFGWTIHQPEHFYYLLVCVLLAQYWLMFRVLQSPFGTALQAMREREVACRTSGLNTAAIKIRLILISSAIAGAAGSLLAHMNGFISPPSFGWAQSVTLWWCGRRPPVLRTLLGCHDPARARADEHPRSSNSIVFGIALILFAFLPNGLAGLARWRTRQVGFHFGARPSRE